MKDNAPVVHNVVTLQFGVQHSVTSCIVTTVWELSLLTVSGEGSG